MFLAFFGKKFLDAFIAETNLLDGKIVLKNHLDFFFYHNKIHPLTNYKAIKNKSNKTRQQRT